MALVVWSIVGIKYDVFYTLSSLLLPWSFSLVMWQEEQVRKRSCVPIESKAATSSLIDPCLWDKCEQRMAYSCTFSLEICLPMSYLATTFSWPTPFRVHTTALYNLFIHNNGTHHFYHSGLLRSAGVSDSNSALSLCGNSWSYLLPKFKGLAKWMLCYVTQITLKNEGHKQLLGMLLENGPLFSDFLGIFWLNPLPKVVPPPGAANVQ